MKESTKQYIEYLDEKKIIEKLETYIEVNHENGIFKSYLEIEDITGVDIHEIIKLIENNNCFKRNSDGKFTTIALYKKYRNFWNKLLDSYSGFIR